MVYSTLAPSSPNPAHPLPSLCADIPQNGLTVFTGMPVSDKDAMR